MVVNLFTNPDMVATDGDVVVWENLVRNAVGDSTTDWGTYSGSGTASTRTVESISPVEGVETAFRATLTNYAGNWFYISPQASNYADDTLPVSPGEWVGGRAWVWQSQPGEVLANVQFRDGVAFVDQSSTSHPGLPANEPTLVTVVKQVPAGANRVNIDFGWRTGRGGVGVGDWLQGTAVMYVKGASEAEVESRLALPFFSVGLESPDPDLTARERPGGGSQLVGKGVAGLSATGGVVVQSVLWSKSGGKSARLITREGYQQTGRAWVDIAVPSGADVRSGVVWYRQAAEVTAHNYTGTLYRFSPAQLSEKAPNVAGETLLRAHWSGSFHSPRPRVEGAAAFGESVWFDLLTLTETEGYDGPPFSGATPNEDVEDGLGWVYEWSGTPNLSTSTRVWGQVRDIYVRVLDEFDAPAVGITVEGLSPTEASRIAIYRQTPGKERTLVQGLGNVDVDGAGYWVDYLPPLGVPVTYVVEVLEGDPLEENSATITIPSSTAWLQDALNPLLAVEVACRPGNRDTLFFTAEAFTAFERPTNSDLVQIMGGRVPVGMTSRRQTPVGIPFNMVTTAAEASSMLREVLIEGTHLVLRVPPEISMLDPVTYLSDVQVSEEPGRQTFLGGHVTRWNMTGSQTRGPRIMAWTALWTYDDVAELYAGYTYTDLTDGRRYVDWMAKPDEAQLAGFSTTSSGGSNA